MLNQAVILLFIISFLDLILGLFVFLKNPRSRVNVSFALFSLFVLIWINSSFFQDELRNVEHMYFLLKVDFASAIFTSFFLLLFCLDVSKSEITKKTYIRILLVAVPVLFSALIFFTKFILSGYEILQGVIDPSFGSAHIVYNVLIGVSLSSGIGTLAWKYRKSSKVDKSKFIYLFIGFLLSSAIAFTTNVLLTDYIKNSPNYNLYSRFGSFSAIFMILFSGYAIVKHRLLNLKILTTELLSLGILVFTLFQVLKSRNLSELIMNSLIFIVLLIFVIMLVRSVESEVKRKEELQVMSDKLAAANDTLRKLDNAKSDFISIASHQIRTPLTAAKGYLSLFLDGSLGKIDTKQRDILSKLYVNNDRLVQLVEDLLNVSKIESGRMEFKFSKWRIEDICQEVVDSLALKAKEKSLSLIFNRPAEALPKLMIDGPKVREVISNMVDNAIKYTSQGGVTVEVKLRKKKGDETTDWIRVTVSDTGIGIPKTELPYLFSKFSRGKDTSRLSEGGTGLGLYVGKSMIENNGGKIWAESEGVEKGSRFIVEIPVEQSKELLERWA